LASSLQLRFTASALSATSKIKGSCPHHKGKTAGRRKMTENPGTEKVRELLKKVHDGSFVIPYFQRGFEWRPRMVNELIESILQNYFTGLLLFWELNLQEAKNEEWEPLWGAERKNSPTIAILDGQQRLSSLYYSIYNPRTPFPNRQSYYSFFIDLNKVLNEEYEDSVSYRFYFSNYQSWPELVLSRDDWARTGVVPLSILSAKDPSDPSQDYIDSVEFEEWIGEYLKHNRNDLPEGVTTHRVYRVFNSILNYSFVFYPLSSSRSLQDICNIFARVNSKGMKLSTFDLMNAFLYPKDVQLRKDLWENLDNERLKEIDASMNEYLLKVISLRKQNYCSAKYIFNLIPGQVITRKNEQGQKYEEVLIDTGTDFKKLWKLACYYAERARNMIMNTGFSDFGAIKQEFIPNTTIIPVLAAILWEFDGDPDGSDFINILRKWYWSAVFSEDYSGSSDTVMAKDYRDWKEWITSRKPIERINRITTEFIEEMDLRNTKKGSSRYNAILCILARNDAKDFFKGQTVGTGDYSNESINDHHVFPSKVKGLDPTKSTAFSSCKDSIVNRTLLLDETNIKIRDKKPSTYLLDMFGKCGDEDRVKAVLAGHLISESAYAYLKQDDFDNFIIERERAIKTHLIQVMRF
jgi:hypothetical protein